MYAGARAPAYNGRLRDRAQNAATIALRRFKRRILQDRERHGTLRTAVCIYPDVIHPPL